MLGPVRMYQEQCTVVVINTESWLSDHFLANAISTQSLLSILDGHSTHNRLEFI